MRCEEAMMRERGAWGLVVKAMVMVMVMVMATTATTLLWHSTPIHR